MNEGNKIISSLKEALTTIPDWRDNRGKKHDLVEILMLAIVGFLMGKTDFTNMVHCLKLQEKELKKHMILKNGIPSHDTFSRVMRKLNSNELIYAICDWFSRLTTVEGKQLIVDGKGIRASAEKNRNKKVPYIVNVLEESTKLVLMQIKVKEKSNEINGIVELLDYMDIKGAVFTIDAIGTQRPIINKIIKKGGHFVLPVKENNEKLHKDIQLYMDELIETKNQSLDIYVDNTKEHNRKEKRTYYSVASNACIDSKDSLSSIVKSVGKVVRERTEIYYDENNEYDFSKKSIQEIYYISDLELTGVEFGNYVRKHWTIENSLHWVLDNTFKEDRSTQKKDNSLENTALIRKVAYNIIRLHKNNMANHSMEYIIDEFRYNLSMTIKYLFTPIDIFDE